MFSARGYPKGAVFSASKHAAIGMVKSAAIEAGRRGIRVNAVMPLNDLNRNCLHYTGDQSEEL